MKYAPHDNPLPKVGQRHTEAASPRASVPILRETGHDSASLILSMRRMECLKRALVPEAFGPLQGVKIVSTGTLIAQPFAAELAAEMGAEVIQVERPGSGDAGWRTIGIRFDAKDGGDPVSTNFIQERRNVFGVTLDFSKPKGKELFLKMIARADIWMESSKPGSYSRWGLDDASVLRVNPKLVITHVSGFGQNGNPDWVYRASYDIVGQAVSGTMFRPGPPTRSHRCAPRPGSATT